MNPDLPETRILMDRSMPRLYLSVIHQHMEEPDAVQVTDDLHGETLLPLLASLVSRHDGPSGAPSVASAGVNRAPACQAEPRFNQGVGEDGWRMAPGRRATALSRLLI